MALYWAVSLSKITPDVILAEYDTGLLLAGRVLSQPSQMRDEGGHRPVALLTPAAPPAQEESDEG